MLKMWIRWWKTSNNSSNNLYLS